MPAAYSRFDHDSKTKKPSSQRSIPLKRRFLCLLLGVTQTLMTIGYNSF